jgi:hypothetical protein
MALHLSPWNELDLEAIDREFPNARKLSGGLFVSHSGRDFQRILREVDPPPLNDSNQVSSSTIRDLEVLRLASD